MVQLHRQCNDEQIITHVAKLPEVIQVADETGNISEMLWRKKKSKRN
jgi:hypothetical protein